MAIPYEARYTPEEYLQKPREYDPELADFIIMRLENGELLPVVCKDRDMPLPATFLKWVALDPDLERRFNAARLMSAVINLDLAAAASEHRDAKIAGNVSRTLMIYAEKMDPARFGPRANIRIKEGDDDGGIDYREEVRRKIETISNKVGPKPEPGTEGT